MTTCLVCGGNFEPFIKDILDYEYGVDFSSSLIRCADCGLVTHSPEVSSEQIPLLYPEKYLAHNPGAKKKSIYGFLKELLHQRTVNKCSRLLPENGTFLEIGCGNADLIHGLSKVRKDAHFIGVDITDVEKPEIPGFSFLLGQLEEVDIAPQSINLIYCSNLIEHVANPRTFLQICQKILVPGGVILGITPDHLSLDRYIFGKYWAGYHYPRHTFVFNHKNIQLLLQSENFTNISIKGGYSFWYLSLANRFINLPGYKKRGLPFALITVLFLPLDFFLNLLTCHGSMQFIGIKPLKDQTLDPIHD